MDGTPGTPCCHTCGAPVARTNVATLDFCGPACAEQAGWFADPGSPSYAVRWVPGPEAIRQQCEQIQAGWTETEKRKRRELQIVRFELPQLRNPLTD